MHALHKRVAATVATSLITVGVVALSGSAAEASGPLMTVSPASGSNIVSPTLTTNKPCGAGTTSSYIKIFGGDVGHAFPADGFLMADPSNSAFSTTSGFSRQTNESFDSAIKGANGSSATLLGSYTLTVFCEDDFGAPKGSFSAPVNFSSATAYTAPAPQEATTTALASSASSVQDGGSVTLTATVKDSTNAVVPNGNVEFYDGATLLGTAVAVNSSGVATKSVTVSNPGSSNVTKSFTAKYTGGTGFGGGYGQSTSSAQVVTVTPTPNDATSTVLSKTSPAGNSYEGGNVTFSATVTDTTDAAKTPTGSVQFKDGGANMGSPVALTGGSASITRSITGVGPHTITADYLPTGKFNPSSSNSVQHNVDANPTSGTENIYVTLTETGTLALSVTAADVTLPDFTLLAGSDLLTSSKDMNDVSITDTRLYEKGWSVSGQVTDFAGTTNPSDTIDGAGLGWTPKNTSSAGSYDGTVTLGSAVAPFAGGSGLKASRTLASAAEGSGRGTTLLNATLLLNAPTTTKPGTYKAVLTLTVV